MLLISNFVFEPFSARWALHHLNEALPGVRLLVAPSSMSHQPLLRRSFNVARVHSSTFLHRKSVDVDVTFIIGRVHLHVVHRAVEELDLGRGVAML